MVAQPIDPKVQRLLGVAFHRTPSALANDAIDRVRQSYISEGRLAVIYEISLPDAVTWADIRRDAVSRFFAFVDSKGISLTAIQDICLPIFCGEELAFLTAKAFLDFVCLTEGLTPDEIRAKLPSWRSKA